MDIETRLIKEYGITLDGVWFPYALLEELGEQRRYDSEWGSAFIAASPEQERVLIARNLAVKETRGGLHSSDTGLAELLRRIKFPGQEPSGNLEWVENLVNEILAASQIRLSEEMARHGEDPANPSLWKTRRHQLGWSLRARLEKET